MSTKMLVSESFSQICSTVDYFTSSYMMVYQNQNKLCCHYTQRSAMKLCSIQSSESWAECTFRVQFGGIFVVSYTPYYFLSPVVFV